MILRLFFTSFVCLSATLFAYAKPTNKEKIDKVRYEITYRTKSIIDTTKVDSLGNFIYNEEDMRLDVGEQVSFFYSYSNALYEQQRIEMMNKGNFSVPNMRGGSISWKLFKNFPTGKTTYVDNVFRDGFRVVEPIEQPQWELIPDSTARILDYNCQMARCNYKGKQTDGTRNIVFDDRFNSYEETSMRNLQQLKANTTPFDAINRGGKGVTFRVVSSSVNGKLTEAQQESMRKQMQKRQPQNPIERL